MNYDPASQSPGTPPKQGGVPDPFHPGGVREQIEMIQKLKTKTIIQFALVLVIAFALKYHYSTATVNDLRWILAPTTLLVEFITGRQFVFESQAGYMSSDHTFLIAASCSGVNFLIIAFLALTLGRIRRAWPQDIEWQFLPIAMVAAYLTTLIANATRIVIALATQGTEMPWLHREELHRVEGIIIYFGFLLLLFWASERLPAQGEPRAAAIVFRSRHLLVIYYAVTLGIPLVRGSYSEPGFVQHALFVILVPWILIVPISAFSLVRNRYKEQELP